MTKIDTTHTLFRSNANGDDYPVHVYTTSTVTTSSIPGAYAVIIHLITDADGETIEPTDPEVDQIIDEIAAHLHLDGQTTNPD